jgi:hypothetical protein
MEHRAPEHEPATDSWTSRIPLDFTGPRADFARAIAEALDARRNVLGERTAEETPEWARRQLGPVPEDPIARADWERRAGIVAEYRELYRVEAEGTIIGPPPGRGMTEQHAAYQAAQQALGRTAEEQQLAEATEAQLRQAIEAYERARQWAPPHVATELETNELARVEYEQEAAHTRRQAELATDPAEREQLATEAADLQDMADQLAELRDAYEVVHQARATWYNETAAEREAAEAARAELERRDQDRAPEQAERQEREQEQPEADADRAAQAPAADRAQEEREQQEQAAQPEREADRQTDRTAEAETAVEPVQEADRTVDPGVPEELVSTARRRRLEAVVEAIEREQAERQAAPAAEAEQTTEAEPEKATAKEALAELRERSDDLTEANATLARVSQRERRRVGQEAAQDAEREQRAQLAAERERRADRAREVVQQTGPEISR